MSRSFEVTKVSDRPLHGEAAVIGLQAVRSILDLMVQILIEGFLCQPVSPKLGEDLRGLLSCLLHNGKPLRRVRQPTVCLRCGTLPGDGLRHSSSSSGNRAFVHLG
jgi:hypothetical protein